MAVRSADHPGGGGGRPDGMFRVNTPSVLDAQVNSLCKELPFTLLRFGLEMMGNGKRWRSLILGSLNDMGIPVIWSGRTRVAWVEWGAIAVSFETGLFII